MIAPIVASLTLQCAQAQKRLGLCGARTSDIGSFVPADYEWLELPRIGFAR
jgi:hypothetical protein